MSWTPEMRGALQTILREHDREICPNCGRVFDEKDIDFRGTQTEAGTEGYEVEISCFNCGREIVSGGGWGSIDSTQDAIDAIDEVFPRG